VWEAARTAQLPNWWGSMADRWAGAVRTEDGRPGSVPCLSRVMCDDVVMDNVTPSGRVEPWEIFSMHRAGPSCSAPLLAAFTAGATAVHARRCAQCGLARQCSFRLELPHLRYQHARAHLQFRGHVALSRKQQSFESTTSHVFSLSLPQDCTKPLSFVRHC
jgi:hypothetical protein